MNELKTLDNLLENLRAMLPQLRSEYKVRSIAVFGSYLQGCETKNSDLDLLITYEELPSLFKFVALENFLSDNLGIKVDLIMEDSLKPNIGKHILEEAQLI